MYILAIIIGLLGMALFSETMDMILITSVTGILCFVISTIGSDIGKFDVEPKWYQIVKILALPLIIYLILWAGYFEDYDTKYILWSYMGGLAGEFILIIGLLTD